MTQEEILKDPVKEAKIHTILNLAILFLDRYYIGKPFGVLDGLDKTTCQ